MSTLTTTHILDLYDQYGRSIAYQTTITETSPGRVWRITGRQLRDNRPVGRGSSPVHVYSEGEAQALAKGMVRRHRRYVERTSAAAQLRHEVAAEEADDGTL